MRLLIAADLVPQSNNNKEFENASIEELLGNELKNIWLNADYRIFNLEAPITRSEKYIDKCGPNLKIDPKTINGIKSLEPTFLLLSNNHIMDYGIEGYRDTVNILYENKIDFIGVGDNKTSLKKSCIYNIANKKIAFYNCCENEFSNAETDYPGANNYDIYNTFYEIKTLKKECDYLIVLYHGGKEHYRYPSPELKRRCEKMIDFGANLIVCQHSHCIGCEQNYNGSKIVYGQGNFIMGKMSNEFRNTSLIISLEIEKDIEIKYFPIVKTSVGTRLATNDEKKKILNDFFCRSENILKDKFVEREFMKFSNDYMNYYLTMFNGNSFLLKVLNKLTKKKFVEKLYTKKDMLAILNFIECEAHREVIISGLKQRIEKMGE